MFEMQKLMFLLTKTASSYILLTDGFSPAEIIAHVGIKSKTF